MNKNILLVLIFIAGAAAGAAGFYFYQSQGQNQNVLSLDESSKIAIDFINKAIENENVTATFMNATEESGVYKIHLKIEDKEYDSFISKDGKYLFSMAFNLEEQKAEEAERQTASLVSLAQCLTEKGAKFYGAFWCSHCQNQKEMFGDASQYLPYIECSAEDGKSQLQICKDNNIASYPTWIFTDNTRETGEVSLEKLAEKTGCQLLQQ